MEWKKSRLKTLIAVYMYTCTCIVVFIAGVIQGAITNVYYTYSVLECTVHAMHVCMVPSTYQGDTTVELPHAT